MSRPIGASKPEGPPTLFTRCLTDDHCLKTDAFLFPFQKRNPAVGLLPGDIVANLSAPARAWLKNLGLPDPEVDAIVAAAPWHHALAITYAPQYLMDNADGITIDWPRIPLPDDPVLLNASAELGKKVAALLDTEANVSGVSSGKVFEHLRVLGRISHTNLCVNAGWGSRDSKGRINPGKGHTETRDWTKAEKEALRIGFASEDIDEEKGFAKLGRAIDVHLNATNLWSGVPEETWRYVIGGYRVIKKWLSYREEAVIGRPINKDEAREFTAMVRRLTALILLSDKLNANYSACCDNSYDWPPA